MSLDVSFKLDRGDGVELSFKAGPGITALFGRSGAGKTTVVDAIAGLVRPQSGHIAMDGRVLFDAQTGVNLKPHQRNMGYVFQQARLFPHMSVAGNLAYGQRRRGGANRKRLAQVAELLGIEQLLDRRPAALSGGEAARVSIGRALLSAPKMLLMDEPFAALDAPRRAEILPYLERLRDEEGLPIVYVSHNVAEVARLADTIVVLEQGRVLRAGPALDVLADPATAAHFGAQDAGAVLLGRVAARYADGLMQVRLSGGEVLLPDIPAAVLGQSLRIRIAARDIILSLSAPSGLSALNVLACTVEELHEQNGSVLVKLRVGADALLARITGRSAIHLGLRKGLACHAIIKSVSVAGGASIWTNAQEEIG